MISRARHALLDRIAGDERGIAMMEVLASALVLAIVAVGLLSGFDVASKASGTNKSRGVAASIAQDDQERMRGLEVRTLVLRGPETREVKAGTVTYTVKSTAEPVSDSGSKGCTAGSTGVDYLRLKSEVTWPHMTIDPVVSDSIMAPRVGSYGEDEGGMSVQVVDRDGQPRSGVAVALAGGAGYNDVTDDVGCAFFAYIPAGDYNVQFSSAGMVTPGAVQAVSDPVSVPVGAVGNKVIQYDQAGSLTVKFQTTKGATSVDDTGTDVAVAHPNVPAPGALFYSSATPVSSIDTGYTLFPFTGSYSVYAGTCPEANPENWGQPVPTVSLGRGATTTVNVLEPPITVNVTRDGKSNNLPGGAKVRFYGVSCSDVFTPSTLTTSVGALTTSMPYGDYHVCAQYPASDTDGSRRYVETSTTVKNQTAAGTSVSLNIRTSSPKSTSGSCPTE